MSILRQVKTVLWGFLGVGGRDRREAQKTSPLLLIAVAFVLVALLLVGLAVIATRAAGG